MSFYLTLPSNSSLNMFPDNNAGHFFYKTSSRYRSEWRVRSGFERDSIFKQLPQHRERYRVV